MWEVKERGKDQSGRNLTEARERGNGNRERRGGTETRERENVHVSNFWSVADLHHVAGGLRRLRETPLLDLQHSSKHFS